MAANPRDILLRPIITEKTSVMLQDNKYTFQVPLTCLLYTSPSPRDA